MGHSGAYPRTMVVRGNAEGAGQALNRRDTRRTDRPPFRRPEVRESRRRFRLHGQGCAPRFQRSPRHPCNPRRRLPSIRAQGAFGFAVRQMPRICKDE